MDTEQAILEITNAIVHLEKLCDECVNDDRYALNYALGEIQQMLLRAERELKPPIEGSTGNS